MELYKVGYIVVTVTDYLNFTYCAWPLANRKNDVFADKFTDEADNKWYTVYDMQEIAPDLGYVKRYFNYCKKIGLDVIILLVEASKGIFNLNDNIVIDEVYGYDCIGTVYYSYLRNNYEDFKNELNLNKYGLFSTYDDVNKFITLRRGAIDAGANLEDFWLEMPVKFSRISI